MFSIMWVVKLSDEKILTTIKDILKRGNNAEIKRKTDGTIVVYEVKKNIVSK